MHTQRLQSQQRKPQTNRGFTLLETMVAIFILVLSITGPMVFSQSGLRAAFLARDQVTAFFLAQDAIETIKNLRDENGLNNRNWLTDICEETAGTICTVYLDTTEENPTVNPCTGGVCSAFDIDDQGRYAYGVTPPNPSRFTRTIYIRETNNEVEAQIVVEVAWRSNVRVGSSRVLVQENMYNWIPIIE